ncbi:MAG: hypothetical protein M3Z92_11090 [Bacteroidota bacterium]|nr:hypothetical protein [Bacteroidota bacterium]
MSNSVQPNYKSLLIQKSFYLFLGKAMPVLILFLITIIFSRRLSYDEYGTFQSVWMYANIVNVILSFGLGAVILSTNMAFLLSFIKKNQKILISFYILLSLTTLLIFFLFAKNFNAATKFLLIGFIIIQNTIAVVENLLIKQGGEKKAFLINFFYSILFFGTHLFILFTNYSLAHLIIVVTIISVIKFFIIIFFTRVQAGNVAINDDKNFMKHWAYLGFNEILGIIAKWIDKIFLLYLLTATDFAIFFNGSFEIPLFGLLVSVTGNFLLIEISGNTRLTDKIVSLFRENFNMLSSIVFPLFFFLFFFREELFMLVFKNKYQASLPVFLISIFVLPIRINNYTVILQCLLQGNKIMWGSILDILIAIILMVLLYPKMGTQGIALSIVISTWFQVVYYLWHSASGLHISILRLVPAKKLLIKFFVLLAVYLLLSLLVQNLAIAVKLILAFLITTVAVIAGMWNYLKSFFYKNYGMDT